MANINDWLLRESGRIGQNINQKLKAKATPWVSLVSKEQWPEGMGASVSTFQWDRAQLTEQPKSWGPVGEDANGAENGGSCVPAADEVKFTQVNRPYNLEQKAIWGPRVCVNNLRYTFVREQQMKASIDTLADQARITWIERNRSEYSRVADNNEVLDSAFALQGGNELENVTRRPSGEVSILTDGYLQYMYEYLNHNGAGEGAMGLAGGRPVYGLSTSARQSRRLIMSDPEIREDFRYSSQNEKLLAPMGIKWNYNGFTHLIDEHIPRFNTYDTVADADGTETVTIASGVATFSGDIDGLTKDSELILADGTKLKIDEVNPALPLTQVTVLNADGTAPADVGAGVEFFLWLRVPEYVAGKANGAWLTATHEESTIFHQRAAVCLVPKPISSVGQAKFMPVNYAGEFTWKNYETEDDNPDGNIGRFRGVLMSGTRPDNPDYGITIRHKACYDVFNAVTDCSQLGSAI